MTRKRGKKILGRLALMPVWPGPPKCLGHDSACRSNFGVTGVFPGLKSSILRKFAAVFSVAFLSSAFQMPAADPVTFQSGPKRVQLLELFTSEGCSSCPPAEAWLSRLIDDSRLWRDFVPIAFHVDYWDHLGWKDPFASSEWTKRQQTYAENWKAQSVYTPAFVLNGREWRNTTIPVVNDAALGALKATVQDSNAVMISFEPANGSSAKFDVYFARLGFGIAVNVRAGENNGRSLKHDFVVLSLVREKMSSGTQEIRFPAASESVTRPERSALAAWVTKEGEITPLQAVGGWLPAMP